MKHPYSKISYVRRGFTLMEMLVAVTIVLLIMLMLAEVFELATGAMVKQKGTAENDQQARMFTTILKEDLNRRTFLDVVPFYPRSENELIETDPEENRKGYFYYAENNPSNQQDDVLGFTMYESVGDRRFLGHAAFLRDPAFDTDDVDDDQDTNIDEADEGNPRNYLYFNSDQPEGDDGLVAGSGNPDSTATDLVAVPNNIGMSKYAEVVYFLRGTNLHRRVLLLRDPYNPVTSTDFTPDYVSSNYPGPAAARYAPLTTDLNPGNATGEFYRDFDYSAYYLFFDNDEDRNNNGSLDPGEDDNNNGMLDTPPRNGYDGPRFNSWQSLNNHPTTLEQLGEFNVPLSLGSPFRRFGHHFLDGLSVSRNPLGRAREFVRPLAGGVAEDANNNGWLDPGEDGTGGGTVNGVLDDQFIGRFLSQESAYHEDVNNNGLLDAGEDLNGNGVLDQFGYPGRITGTAVGTPIQTIYTNSSLTLNTQTFEVNQLSGNTIRRGEDILMTNVTEFDVQILDDGLPTPKFVNLGHSEKNSGGSPIGFYNITRNQSFFDSDSDGQLDYSYDPASQKFLPTEPLLYGNRYDSWYARQITDLSSNPIGPGSPSSPGTANNENLTRFVRPPYRPYAPGQDSVPGDQAEASVPWRSFDSATADPPDTDTLADYLDVNNNGDYDVGIDFLAEDYYGYPGSDDIPYPVKAIKITVRFVDPTNKLIRQVTIIESLVK